MRRASGEERHAASRLKLLADVRLVGYPNVGKSTLISRISAARPKIADYPLPLSNRISESSRSATAPHEMTLWCADIPGLIEGGNREQPRLSFCATSSAPRLWSIWSTYQTPATGRSGERLRSDHGELDSFGAAQNQTMILAASKVRR